MTTHNGPSVDETALKVKTTGKRHSFHLVSPSPWPLLTSMSLFILTLGAVLYMHSITSIPLLVGVLCLLSCMGMWFRDVIHESVVDKAHTEKVSTGLRIGFVMFIASEVMFFVAFFWSFFDYSLFPTEYIGHVWPPKNVQVMDPFHFPYLNTLLLLLSGTTVTWAHHAIIHGKQKESVQALATTVGIGILFLAVQAFEYAHAPFKLKDGLYPTNFYLPTGFHGLHVLVGTIFLAVCLYRSYKQQFTPQKHVGFETAAWYWHFVDVVWLFLFVSIYWWGSQGAALAE